jgi:hypothetical protein
MSECPRISRILSRCLESVCTYMFTITSFWLFFLNHVPNFQARSIPILTQDEPRNASSVYGLVKICSLTRTAHTDTPEPLQSSSKGRPPRHPVASSSLCFLPVTQCGCPRCFDDIHWFYPHPSVTRHRGSSLLFTEGC